ncbi:Lecithin:cholesterol/phospholipid:diacylglycerol acyltransferase, partial [Baffinella frigidus]
MLRYDPSLMHMASYDWRLPFQLLEKRDQYFTRLSFTIEAMYFTRLSFTIEAMVHGSGHKAVVIVHSMGGNVFLYFTRWATVHRGEDWVNKYIHGFVSLATPFLGVPKGVAALLSGEAKDTAEMGVLGSILDRHMSRWERRRLFRSWGSTPVMLPKGGDAIWGRRHHPALDFNETETTKAGRTASETIASLLDAAKAGPETDGRLANYEAWHSHGMQTGCGQQAGEAWHSHGLREGDFLDGDYFNNSRTWANPLESQLPNAPDLKIFCLYGIGQPTERAYMYTRTEGYDEGMVAAAATAENLTKEEAWE